MTPSPLSLEEALRLKASVIGGTQVTRKEWRRRRHREKALHKWQHRTGRRYHKFKEKESNRYSLKFRCNNKFSLHCKRTNLERGNYE